MDVKSSIYAKGCQTDADRDWYHGKLTRDLAEATLRASGSNCFLIRESEGSSSLVLSLIQAGDFSHVKIEYTPEGYCLKSKSVQKFFKDLHELIAYYCKNDLSISSKLAMTLGEVCKKREESATEIVHHRCIDGPADSNIYAKACFVDSNKDWYHGELTRDQAEEALRASGSNNCFLIRESGGRVFLSLIHHGEIHHFVTEYGPGWYSLEGQPSRFTRLDEMVAYYCSNAVIDQITLGQACTKMEQNYTETETYTKGVAADLTRHNWYHGEKNREEAESLLKCKKGNALLVRHSENDLVLSMQVEGCISHTVIRNSPKGCHLEGKEKMFKTIPEMVSHCQMFTVEMGIVSNRDECDTPVQPEYTPIFTKARPRFEVTWRKCADLPVPRSATQVVRIGNYVYVDEGFKRPGKHETAILRYHLKKNTWKTLPKCPTSRHGLTTLNNELVVIGGTTGPSAKETNAVYTLRKGSWKRILPPMPTARSHLSVITHQDKFIIAAGGILKTRSNGQSERTDIVEIYDTVSKHWYTTRRLPFKTSSSSISIVDGKCYLLGGYGTLEKSCTLVSASLSSLHESSLHTKYSVIPETWEIEQSQHPLAHPTITSVNRTLFALGGADQENKINIGTRYISMHNSQTSSWMECKGAELPFSVFRPGVVRLDNDELMIVGGNSKTREAVSQVFIGKFTKQIVTERLDSDNIYERLL